MMLFRLAMLIGVVAIGMLQGFPAEAQSEPRARIDGGAAPWRSIGKVQAAVHSLRSICTGFLVDPRTVVTAAHCLFNVRTRHYFSPASVHFLLALAGSRFASATVADSLVIAPGYDPDKPNVTRGNDWALLRLAAALPDTELLELAPAVPPPGTAAMVGGYGQDNPNVLTADTACHITGRLEGPEGQVLLTHDCHAVGGVSGAPLLAWAGAKWTIAGVNVARTSTGTQGFAVPVDAFAKNL